MGREGLEYRYKKVKINYNYYFKSFLLNIHQIKRFFKNNILLLNSVSIYQIKMRL